MPDLTPSNLPQATAARRLSPGASLQMATVAWHHSLRFRLALTYTLASLLILAVLGIGILAFMLSQMDRQFQARLEERADTIAESFINPRKGLRDESVARLPPTGYTAIIDNEGNIAAISQAFKTSKFQQPLKRGDHFPHLEETRFEILGIPVRAVMRSAGDFGEIWVALPEEDLQVARKSAINALMIVLLGTPVLMMLLGWFVGRRALRSLGDAANLADQIDPSASLAALPLPAREDEVHRLISAINRLMGRIESVQAREKQLLGQIVHELGAPLTVLKASLNRAGERTGDQEVQRAALVADELTFTTQDLMQLARGQLEMKLAWHYISARNLQGRLDRLVPAVDFLGDWSGGILCDPDRLTQALRNLLANARRAAGSQGFVHCTLEETSELLTFTVHDSGTGLPPDLGERIFDPFVSGSGSSGLGLSVSRQIARIHGGELIGKNHEEGGALFVLTIPGVAVGDEE